jgi:hypothetical protein
VGGGFLAPKSIQIITEFTNEGEIRRFLTCNDLTAAGYLSHAIFNDTLALFPKETDIDKSKFAPRSISALELQTSTIYQFLGTDETAPAAGNPSTRPAASFPNVGKAPPPLIPISKSTSQTTQTATPSAPNGVAQPAPGTTPPPQPVAPAAPGGITNPTPPATPPTPSEPKKSPAELLGLQCNTNGNLCYNGVELNDTAGNPIPESAIANWTGSSGKIPAGKMFLDDIIAAQLPATALGDIKKYKYRLYGEAKSGLLTDAQKRKIVDNGITALTKGKQPTIYSMEIDNSGAILLSEKMVGTIPSTNRIPLKDKNGDRIKCSIANDEGKFSPQNFAKNQLAIICEMAPDLLVGGAEAARKLIDDPNYMKPYVPA